jgi:hypothetical protein
MNKDEVPEFPLLYEAANSAAVRYQRYFLAGTAIQLSGLVCAAASASASLPVAVAGFLTISTFARLFLLATHPERAWYEARAVAESAKSLAWRYAVGGDPLGIEDKGDADKVIRARFSKLIEAVRHAVIVGQDTGVATTGWMRNLRAEGIELRRQRYLDQRVRSQQAWYRDHAASNEFRARAWMLSMLALQAGTVLAAVVATTQILAISSAGTVAALAAAAAVWLQARQHELLASSYALTHLELGNVASSLAATFTEAEWARVVDESEEAMSREHTMWQASRFDPR